LSARGFAALCEVVVEFGECANAMLEDGIVDIDTGHCDAVPDLCSLVAMSQFTKLLSSQTAREGDCSKLEYIRKG
jgi:hypothetical protein